MTISRTSEVGTERRQAVYSKDERYRYVLRIDWDRNLSRCQFIGLNPSTATELKDDPTVRRCKDFARALGYGGMVMTNIFAFRATDPGVMRKQEHPVGERDPACVNLRHIIKSWRYVESDGKTGQEPVLIACWGNHGEYNGQGGYTAAMLIMSGAKLKCFGKTKTNHPKHPLYLSKNSKLIDLV